MRHSSFRTLPVISPPMNIFNNKSLSLKSLTRHSIEDYHSDHTDNISKISDNISDTDNKHIDDDDVRIFTVIGQEAANNNIYNQQKWIFYDASELILGLQCVHHSET